MAFYEVPPKLGGCIRDQMLSEVLAWGEVDVTQYSYIAYRKDLAQIYPRQGFIYEVEFKDWTYIFYSNDTFKPSARLIYYDYDSAFDFKRAMEGQGLTVQLRKLLNKHLFVE